MEGEALSELKSMQSAPKDGTEILAYHIEGKSFHPIVWKDYKWVEGYIPHWGMRWNEGYYCTDAFYSGWIDYPTREG